MDRTLGSIIAFEGHENVISTQLRLLPTSSQILILPNIESYLSSDAPEQGFKSHTYIRKIHDAAKARNDAAWDFLQGSTPSTKRLVFLNGGTSQAHSLCIKAIMQYQTDGDAIKAESIFKDLIQGGTAGLEARGESCKRVTETSFLDDTEDCYWSDDPVTRAMRAAEALDRLTASLQPSNELDLTIASRPRSSSLPMGGYSDSFRDSAPFFLFDAEDSYDAHGFLDEACETSTSSTSRRTLIQYDQLFELYENTISSSHSPPLSPASPTSCIGEAYLCSPEDPSSPSLNTPWSEVYSPFSPRCSQSITYGEASVLDMRGSSRKVVRRVRSLDRAYTASPKYRDASFPLETPESAGVKTSRWRPSSCIVESNPMDSWSHESNCIDGPRTIFVKPKRPTISISPVPYEKKRKSSRSSSTDSDTTAGIALAQVSSTEQILPFTEHLVIYFKEDMPDVLLESVIDSFKAGAHPSFPSAEIDETDVPDPSLPQTPQSPQTFQNHRLSVVSEESSNTPPSIDDDYDPFAYTHPAWPQPKPSRKARTLSIERPPTPARTPTPSMIDQRECFHDFHVTAQQTAVATQNTLRSILNVYYPPESQSHRQFQFLLPELEGVWNPNLHEAEPDSPRRTNRKIDQVVAIGAQGGVSKAFMSSITGQLEKLGVKSHGLSRTGRLDFRYLLANAMQAFTAQPLANQTCDNPFNNPYLLATLIVPHLESYLALHAESRYLLLEYPPEHLATILALQKLVGVDLMKVAQIVNPKGSEQLPFTHIRGASVDKNVDDLSVLRVHKRSPSSSPKLPSAEVTFDKVNFLLASTASEAEINTFVATVLRILTGVSSFYKPEETLTKPATPKSKPPSVQPAFSSFSRAPSTHTMPVTSASVFTPAHSLSPPSLRRSSLGESIDSTRTQHKLALRRRRDSPTSDYVSAFTLDFNVDHDLQMEERRLMPMYMHKPTLNEGNSRKALKFLGLA